ncbi:MAG: TetR/AcrR family transcriptional regulator [Peptostreptococcaceae bacterium]
MNFSKKEIEIFEGFSKLLESNIDITNIKVEDIAKYSSVGKGTIYSYFSSKEEVIAKATLYNMMSEINKLVVKSEKCDIFENKCMVFFEELYKLMNEKYRYFQLIISSDSINKIISIANEDSVINNLKGYLTLLIEKGIECAINENVINKDLDKDYMIATFFSVFSGFCIRIRSNIANITKEELNRQIEISYKMLIKALS